MSKWPSGSHFRHQWCVNSPRCHWFTLFGLYGERWSLLSETSSIRLQPDSRGNAKKERPSSVKRSVSMFQATFHVDLFIWKNRDWVGASGQGQKATFVGQKKRRKNAISMSIPSWNKLLLLVSCNREQYRAPVGGKSAKTQEKQKLLRWNAWNWNWNM